MSEEIENEEKPKMQIETNVDLNFDTDSQIDRNELKKKFTLELKHIFAGFSRFINKELESYEKFIEDFIENIKIDFEINFCEGITEEDTLEVLKAIRYSHCASQKDIEEKKLEKEILDTFGGYVDSICTQKDFEVLKASLDKHEKMINFLLAEINDLKEINNLNESNFSIHCPSYGRKFKSVKDFVKYVLDQTTSLIGQGVEINHLHVLVERMDRRIDQLESADN